MTKTITKSISAQERTAVSKFLAQFHSEDLDRQFVEKGTIPILEKHGIEHEVSHFASKKVPKLQKVAYRKMTSSKKEFKPRGIILHVHGMGSTSSWHVHRGFKFVHESQLIWYGFDTVSHGQTYDHLPDSEKKKYPRGYLDNFDHLPELTLEVIDLVLSKESESLPLYICAESMGGLVSLIVQSRLSPQQKKRIHCLFLEAPALEFPMAPSNPILKLGGNIFEYLFPTKQPFTYDPKRGTLNHEFAAIWAKHPLTQSSSPVKTLFEIVRAAEQYKRHYLHKFDFPCIVIQGDQDTTVDPKGAKKLHAINKNQDKLLVILQDMKHALSQEYSLGVVHSIYQDFLDRKTTPAESAAVDP